MKTRIESLNVFKRVAMALMLMFAFIFTSTSVFAAEPNPAERENDYKTITFSNLESVGLNESIEMEIIDEEGNPATIGIEKVSLTKNGSTDWKVYYTGVVINAHFYMTVSNNKVTNVYDDWILVIGGSYSDDKLTKSTSYGKLEFKVEAYGGIAGGKCWLKGTTTGSDNDITVTYQM